MSFESDLQIGKTGEQLVMDYLSKLYIALEPNTNWKSRSDFDITAWTCGISFTLEVKYDVYAEKSGNIAIEIFNLKLNMPSGVVATKADLWVHITTNPISLWVANAESLRTWLLKNKPIKIVGEGGDGNATLFLYRKALILNSAFKLMTELTAENLVDLVNENKNSINSKCGESAREIQRQILATKLSKSRDYTSIRCSGG